MDENDAAFFDFTKNTRKMTANPLCIRVLRAAVTSWGCFNALYLVDIGDVLTDSSAGINASGNKATME